MTKVPVLIGAGSVSQVGSVEPLDAAQPDGAQVAISGAPATAHANGNSVSQAISNHTRNSPDPHGYRWPPSLGLRGQADQSPNWNRYLIAGRQSPTCHFSPTT